MKNRYRRRKKSVKRFKQRLLLGLGFVYFIFSIVVNNKSESNVNPSYHSLTTVERLNGGTRDGSPENTPKISGTQALELEQRINRHKMLINHFPDWEKRMDYQKEREKFYRSGLTRIAQAKRVRVDYKLTKQEQDAFDYFTGQNFYKDYQSLETPPNIFDTRSSFLLKIEKNKDMRENFLKNYKLYSKKR